MSGATPAATPRALPVAIIGGGIGGLVLALLLRQRGISANVYEQATELAEIGAAVALSANSTRELERLGLLEQLAAVSTEPTELIYRRWQDGVRIAAFPVRKDAAYRKRFGAPLFGTHRADLQRILGGALGRDALHLGHRLVNLRDRGGVVELAFANGGRAEADLVIGADGVRSVVRRWVVGEDKTMYSRTSGFRGIVPSVRLPSLPDPQAIQFWVGPNAHLLHYAIGGEGDAINFLAVVEGPAAWDQEDSWLSRIEPGQHLTAFRGWHPAVTEMIDAVAHVVRWGLFMVRPLSRWVRGRVVLLGDAAHGMLPHHGQGANTTIEDAVILAELLSRMRVGELDAALQRYQELRRARTRKIQRGSWAANTALHVPDGPALTERNRRFARFAEDFGWIHEFDALRSVPP